MPIPHRGIKGEIVEVRRSDRELCVDWRIRRFLHLPGEESACYKSPRFVFSGARWRMRVYPNREPSGQVDLCLDRDDDDDPDASPRTLNLSAGLRTSSGGVVKRRLVEKFEFNNGCWVLHEFCRRSELREKKDRLMPGGVLTFTCKMKLPAARGVTNDDDDGDSLADSEDESYEEDSSEDEADDNASKGRKTSEQQNPEGNAEKRVLSPYDYAIRMPVAPANRIHSSDKRGELSSGVLVTYSYKELQTATHNFGDLPLQAGGCKVGEGGFGTVYRAVIRDAVVAVKRLNDPVDKQFMTELMTLTNYKHENLLTLIGFSLCPTDGYQCCLLYEYMPNGSLEDRLACADGSEPLSWQTRLSISYGTALGINHLHTFGEKPMVHRDIKSANILLDQNYVPKVGDFGLARTGSRGVRSSTNVFTDNPSGTLVYMPWEAFKGEVSVKWDTFSFGVILLELLTGLPPFEPNREDKDLVIHMELCEDIRHKLDPRADWNREAATELYRIARTRCLVYSWRSRSTISEILEDLRILSSAKKKTQRKKSFLSLLLKMK